MIRKFNVPGGLAALAMTVFAAVPAKAAIDVLYVNSVIGSDANPCDTAGTPCLTIGGAIGKANPGAVIHVMPGEYPGFNVTQQVDISVDGGYATIRAVGITACGVTGGIAVTGAGYVRLNGFIILAEYGITDCSTNSSLHIENSFINSFTGAQAIYSITSGTSELHVQDTTIVRSSGGAVRVQPTSGSMVAKFTNLQVENPQFGIAIDGVSTAGSVAAIITNSTIVGSNTFGLYVNDNASGVTNVTVDNTVLSGNGNQGIVSNGAATKVRVSNSTITSNARGVQPAGGSQLISQGGNVVAGNTIDGAFTSSFPLK